MSGILVAMKILQLPINFTHPEYIVFYMFFHLHQLLFELFVYCDIESILSHHQENINIILNIPISTLCYPVKVIQPVNTPITTSLIPCPKWPVYLLDF
ncbi:MAG: hypothetical protein BWY70_01805 [Bacteroidetes bacterium ADurb.Bin408]|nr:MAG: hypothetical protein BWY70_01805 [Bacteroidetes bacterium ADurb.Bin408]